jgi:putative inorganic carbon (hco3(-)) transporter
VLLPRVERIYLRLTESAAEALEFREALAGVAWRMTLDHPIAGVGLNTFVYHTPIYDLAGTSRIKAFPVHNVYMLELAETGVPGLAAFAVLVLAALWTVGYACRQPGAPAEQRLLALALLCGLAGFWLSQMVDYVYRIPVITTLVWGHVGLALYLLDRRASA